MKHRFVSIRLIALIISLSGFLLAASSCYVSHPRHRVDHDRGCTRGGIKALARLKNNKRNYIKALSRKS